LHVFNVARLFRLTREGCLHAKPSLKITNHGRRKVLIHVRIYEHRAAAGRTSNLKRLVRLSSDRMIAYLKFFRISPADAVALSLALRALTAGKAFSGVAKNSVHEPTRASVRPARSIFLYFEDQSWPALGTTIPLCCNYCRSSHASLSVFSRSLFLILRQSHHVHAAELFWVFKLD
jgi:hypothetical protein